MARLLSLQLDFIYLVSGTAFLLLAAVCLGLERTHRGGLPWRWLGLFGIAQGLGSWIALLALPGIGPTLPGAQWSLTVASFLFLAEFGRAGLAALGYRVPGRWILVLLVALTGLGLVGGLQGLWASSAYALGLVGGLATAWVLYLSARAGTNGRRSLRAAATAMALFALTVALFPTKASFPPASFLNSGGLISVARIPVQLIQVVLAVVATIGVWRYSRQGAAAPPGAARGRGWRRIKLEWWLVAGLLLILVGGWLATEFTGLREQRALSASLLSEARLAAATIETDRVKTLTATPSDVGRSDYERLKQQMISMRSSNSDLHYVYLMTETGGAIVFAVDDDPPGSPEYTDPGLVYKDAPAQLAAVFASGRALVEGPYTDRWGQFVSGFVPVKDGSSGRVLAVLGMDIDYSNWVSEIAAHRLPPLAVTLLLALIAIGFYVAQQRSRESTRLVHDSLAWKSAILENSTAGILVLDSHREVAETNPRLLEMLGYTEAELVGSNVEVLNVSPEACARFGREFYQPLLRGKAVDTEFQMRRKDSEIFWAHISGRAIDAADPEKGSVWVLRDVDQRVQAQKALRESESKFRGISTSAFDAIVMSDQQGAVTFWNEAAQRMFGYSQEEALERDVRGLIMSSGSDGPGSRLFAGPKEGLEDQDPGQTVEMRAIRKDGSEFPVEVSVARVDSNGEWNAASVIRDITERKRTEDQFRQMALEAEAANQAKGEFLANMSHEIRTPMNGILGMTGLLLHTDLDEEQREYADTVRGCADSLLSIINSILDFSKLESGRFELEETDFDLRSVLGDVTDLLGPRASEKGLELMCVADEEVPSTVRGDPGRLRQILLNLVGNALKFTPAGEVTIYASSDSETDSEVVVRFLVSDTGIGVPQDKIDLLFDPFVQADASVTRRFGGTGLGLAISRQLVEMMGGRIGAESTEGVGSIFWFTVRLKKSRAETLRRERTSTEIRDERILLVDDNSTNRRLLSLLLESWGCDHDEAGDAMAALHRLRAAAAEGRPYRLAILDMMMPEVDGETLGRLVKADPTLAETKLLMMSSAGRPGDRGRLKEMGFAGYLVKPVKQSQLFDCIADILAEDDRAREAEAEVRPSTLVKHVSPTAGPARILLAEDNATNRKVALKLLEMLDLGADVASNGVEALEAMRSNRYDLVLMDIQMPEMDGFETTRHLRDPRSRVLDHDVPVIAMTADAMQGDRQRCLAAGMDDYIAKPIDPEAFAEVLSLWLGTKRGEMSVKGAHRTSRGRKKSPADEERPPVFDREGAMQRLMQDEALLQEVVAVFVDEAPRQLASLRKSIEEGNSAEARRAAHSLKGAAGNVGATAVQSRAMAIERAVETGNMTKAGELLLALEHDLEEFSQTFASEGSRLR